ncbi:MAG: transposase-like protein, partial [Colwellia sp.]
MTTRKKYLKEFKLDTISLVRDQNINTSEVSKNLGIRNKIFGRWIK